MYAHINAYTLKVYSEISLIKTAEGPQTSLEVASRTLTSASLKLYTMFFLQEIIQTGNEMVRKSSNEHFIINSLETHIQRSAILPSRLHQSP